MEKIKREKLVAKIVCAALAIILWLYVSYEEDPYMSKTVRNVPLAITGEQALKENGFSVYSLSEKGVDVKVTSKRLSLVRLNNKTISAAVNVSSIKKEGKHVIPATISSSIASNASYYVKGKDITVVIERIKSSSYDIEPNIEKTGDPSLILNTYKLSSDKTTISAPQSIMKEIASVRTEPIIPERDITTKKARLIAYGKNGKPLEGAECFPSEIEVSYSFFDVKTVPVVLKTTAGYSHPLPSENKVKIYGSGPEFDSIKKIETVEVNIALYEPGSPVRIALIIPKGVSLMESNDTVEVVLEKEFYPNTGED